MRVVDVDINRWIEYVGAMPFHSFFQMPYWAMAHQETHSNMKAIAKMFIFDDGKEALVPMIETRTIGLKSRYSTMNGYGGFLSDKPLSNDQIMEIADYLKHNVVSSSICPHPLKTCNINGYDKRMTFTHMLKVSKPDTMFAQCSHSCRKNINRSQKEGLKLTVGSISDIGTYYRIYNSAVVKRGSKESMIPEKFLFNLLKVSSGKARLLFVEKEGVTIAGVIMLYGKGESFQYHASAYYVYENLRPTNFWEWEVLKYAYDNGYEIHDFGSSEGLEGVKSFKESFGSERVNYPYYTYRNSVLKAIGI